MSHRQKRHSSSFKNLHANTQGIKVPTKSKSIITTNVTYTCLSSITALFLSPQNHELLSVGRLPSHSQKQREKHDENPKTLHAEASYLSLSLYLKIHASDVRDRWVHLLERLMKQVHRCTRILILSLLPVSVFVPIFLLSNTLRHFNSGNERITIMSWKDFFIVSLSVLLVVRYCLCVKYSDWIGIMLLQNRKNILQICRRLYESLFPLKLFFGWLVAQK